MYDNVHVVAYEMDPSELNCTMLQVLDFIDMSLVPEDFKFLPNHKYLVIGNKEPKELWESIVSKIHLGPRGEGYADCSKMDYLKTYDDVIFKFTYDFLLTEKVEKWLRSEREYKDLEKNLNVLKMSVKNPKLIKGISKKTGKPWYRYSFENLKQDIINFVINDTYIKKYPLLKKYVIVRETKDVDKAINYLLNLKPVEGQKVVRLGMDYETNGFPFEDPNFMVMGVSIADLNRNAIYFDIEWMQHVGNNLDHFLPLLKKVFDTYHEEIYTYNVNFEQRVTYLLLNKLYFFSDAATLNKLDCLVYKNFSLKYTAMKNLHTKSWDDQFDYLCDKINILMNGKSIKGRAGKVDILIEPCTLQNYEESNIWKEIMSNLEYKAEESEFKRLLNAYWGNQFACIPSKILGKYCCWDSFNTVLLRLVAQTRYSDEAWVMYNNNLRLGSLLQLHGAVIDVPYREWMASISSGMIAYSQCNAVRLWLYHEMKYLNIKYVEIPELDNIWKSWNRLFTVKVDKNGTVSTIMDTKNLISGFIADTDNGDESDDYGFKPKFKDMVGEELYEEITNLTDSMVGVVSPAIKRRKKYFETITDSLSSRWNLSYDDDSTDIEVDGVHYHFDKPIDQVEDFFIYYHQFQYLTHLQNQIDPNNPKDSYVDINDHKVITHDIGELCCSIKNVDSPQEVPYLRLSLYEEFMYNFIYIQHKQSIEKDDLNKVITKDDITDEIYKETCEKDNNLGMIESCYKISKSIIENRLPQMKGEYTGKELRSNIEPEILFKAKRNYKRYLEDKNPVRFVRSCIIDHVFDMMGKGDDIQEEITNDGEDFDLSAENGKINQVSSTVGLKYHHPDDIVKWRTVVAAMTNLRQDYYLEHFNKYCFIKLSTDECADEFYKNFNNIDICDGSIAAYCKAQLCFTSSKKYEKCLGTYLEGQFSSYTKLTNGNDSNLISTERYHKVEELKTNKNLMWKMYSPMNVCEKQSKRWSGPMHTVPSRSEVKRCCSTPDGYLMSYFKQHWSSKTALIAGKTYTVNQQLYESEVQRLSRKRVHLSRWKSVA